MHKQIGGNLVGSQALACDLPNLTVSFFHHECKNGKPESILQARHDKVRITTRASHTSSSCEKVDLNPDAF